MVFLYHGLYALCESYQVRVIAFQKNPFFRSFNLNHIYSTNGPCFRTENIDIRYYFFLVWNSDVQPFEFRISLHYFHKVVNGWYLKVFVNSVNVLVSKLLVEVAD